MHISLKILILFNVFFIFKTKGQNLVLNPSFEDYKLCPSHFNLNYTSDIMQRFCQHWESIGTTQRLFVGGGGQYYNSCAIEPKPMNGLPAFWFGYQHPNTGNALAQITINSSSSFYESRIYYGVYLIEPLVIGKKYIMGFHINLADSSKTACNNIGLRLFTNKIAIKDTTSNNDNSYDNFAHVYTDKIIEDKDNWIKIEGEIVADSAYKYLAVGNFFNKKDTKYKFNLLNTYADGIYYLIDDIYLMEANKSIKSEIKTYCINDTAIIEAVGADKNFYWSLNKADTLSIESKLVFVLTSNTTLYLVSTNTIDSVQLTVIPRPDKKVPEFVELCLNSSETINAYNTYADSYYLNNKEISPIFELSYPGAYILRTITKTCSRTDTINVYACKTTMHVPNAFSPNNDGINDVFKPVGIQVFNYELNIYNRWGSLVFYSNQVEIGWDGKDAPNDVYFYSITYTDIENKNTYYKKGNVTLMR